jgi:hypothetical protein
LSRLSTSQPFGVAAQKFDREQKRDGEHRHRDHHEGHAQQRVAQDDANLAIGQTDPGEIDLSWIIPESSGQHGQSLAGCTECYMISGIHWGLVAVTHFRAIAGRGARICPVWHHDFASDVSLRDDQAVAL